MLDIAEKCFARIAEQLKVKGLSVEAAFERFVQMEEIEGEQMLLMSPVGFLEAIRDLGIEDFEEIEVACLMRVLAKPNMDSAILLTELIVIMENFGIGDDEDQSEGKSEVVGGGGVEETPGEEKPGKGKK